MSKGYFTNAFMDAIKRSQPGSLNGDFSGMEIDLAIPLDQPNFIVIDAHLGLTNYELLDSQVEELLKLVKEKADENLVGTPVKIQV